jgi:hypothetical protein
MPVLVMLLRWIAVQRRAGIEAFAHVRRAAVVIGAMGIVATVSGRREGISSSAGATAASGGG